MPYRGQQAIIMICKYSQPLYDISFFPGVQVFLLVCSEFFFHAERLGQRINTLISRSFSVEEK